MLLGREVGSLRSWIVGCGLWVVGCLNSTDYAAEANAF